MTEAHLVTSEFTVGDHVYVEDSAQPDCTLEAWQFIETHRKGTIVKILVADLPTGKNMQCAVDFGAEFSGGHYCSGFVKTRAGQWITSQHLAVCCEESREVQTVPNIETVNT